MIKKVQISRRVIMSASLVVGTLIVIGNMYVSGVTNVAMEEDKKEPVQEQYDPSQHKTFSYAISGTVEASDSITVRALTDGIVQESYVHIGDVVQQGQVLLTQETPLLVERTSLQNEQNKQTALMQDASVIGRISGKDSAETQSYAASTAATLTNAYTTIGTEGASGILATQLQGSVTTLLSILDFIDTHKSYFSGTDLEHFRETVAHLYGDQYSYLGGTMRYTFKNSNDILAFLTDVTSGVIYPDTDTLIRVAELLDAEMEVTREVLVGGEHDFLNRTTVVPYGDLYNTYFTSRGNLIESQANLRSALNAVRGTTAEGSISNHEAQTNVSLQHISRITAQNLLENAVQTKTQSHYVSSALMNVLEGELRLGMPSAPFAGFIEDIFVDNGEFITAGTPLVTLVGTGMREVEIVVPYDLLKYMKEGDPFSVEGVVVGAVARYSKTATQGNGKVIIDLFDDSFVPGSTIHGVIEMTVHNDTMHVVPHAYVSFDHQGAFVDTVRGEIVRVTVVYDSGYEYVLLSSKPLTQRIRKMIGVSF